MLAEDREAYLNRVLIGGRERVSITVVDYDETWPARFEQLTHRVEQALGARALSIDHIGSTSVPGLAAKPIIDMLLTVEDVAAEQTYVPPLQSVGFALRVREAAHRMLRTPGRDAHLHVYEPQHPDVRACLDLRDWLRIDAADRDRYAAVKRRLARQQWRDMNDYADAKTAVVHEILDRARAWRAVP